MRYAKKFVLLILMFSMIWLLPQNTFAKEKATPKQSIANYIESYTKKLLKNVDKYEIRNGTEFSEAFENINKQIARNAYTNSVALKYDVVQDGTKIEVTSKLNKNSNYQNHNVTIETSNNEHNVVGTGSKIMMNDTQFIFKTSYDDINLNTYVGNSSEQEVFFVDTLKKKVYSFSIKMYHANDKGKEPIKVKNTIKIFTYDDELAMNDYASLYFAKKQGTFVETSFSVDRKEFTDKYSKILNGFNLMPIYYDMDINRPYIYIYETLAQISNPNWEFHFKTPFYHHLTKTQFNADDAITTQQINDLDTPFKIK